MKLLKRPVFWVALAMLALLGFTVSGYMEPAQVRFVNETKAVVQNLRLSFASGAQSIPILPPGQSVEGPIKLRSGELRISLDTPDGTTHTQPFQFTWGPRETVVFHIVDSPPVDDDWSSRFRANGLTTNVDFRFNLRANAP
jgi:hypothetical protein